MFTNAKKNTIFSLPKIYICTRKKICQRKKCVKESNIRICENNYMYRYIY